MPPPITTQVGQLNVSQLLYTYGVGALVDLPQLSVIITGLDDWPVDPSIAKEISEERLLQAVRAALGQQVKQLRFPPASADSPSFPEPFSEQARVGVPVAIFPRWMVCPACRLLAPLASDLFLLKADLYHPDRTRYVHVNCSKANKPPTVVPARFLAACERGHLDDFPWVEFVHDGPAQCGQPLLRLIEYGPSGEARDLEVKCDTCGARRRLSEAIGRENSDAMPMCRGRRPHLRDYDADGCEEHMRTIALGASNTWFPQVISTIAIPEATNALDMLVEEEWATLDKATTLQVLQAFHAIGQLGAFTQYSLDQVWEAIERKRSTQTIAADPTEQPDLKAPEWNVFSQPDPARNAPDFRLRLVETPPDYADTIAQVVQVERMREVQALVGFTRIDSPSELAESDAEQFANLVSISRKPPSWVPAVEVRGEALFIRFSEARIQDWLNVPSVKMRELLFHEAHTRWRKTRMIENPEKYFPGLRYVLLHSFAHVLMRQFALECGYTSASIRERIYAREPQDEGGPMAGILIYTAAPDSEGTLGGLVSLGEPVMLGRHIDAALDSARLCASDPTCAEHEPSAGDISMHAAACHACMFAPETSCERTNRYLDRSLLAGTVEHSDLAFFTNHRA